MTQPIRTALVTGGGAGMGKATACASLATAEPSASSISTARVRKPSRNQ